MTLDEYRTDRSEIQKSVPNLAKETEIKNYSELFMEEVAFGLNLFGQILHTKIGGERKGSLLENIADHVALELNLSLEDFDANIVRSLITNRQGSYGALAFPKNRGPLKGTLFWEYGKYLSLRCSVINPIIITEMSKNGMSNFQSLGKAISRLKL